MVSGSNDALSFASKHQRRKAQSVYDKQIRRRNDKKRWGTKRETEESDETRKDVANRSSIPKHRGPIYLSEGARCGA